MRIRMITKKEKIKRRGSGKEQRGSERIAWVKKKQKKIVKDQKESY